MSISAVKPRSESRGRYNDKNNIPEPRGGVSRPLPSQKVRTAVRMERNDKGRLVQRVTKQRRATGVAVVEDPDNPKGHHLATVNRHADVLELEHSHKRISKAAYEVGRTLQGVFERGTGVRGRGVSSYEPAPRGNPADARQVAMAMALDDAEKVELHKLRLAHLVGDLGARFLYEILGSNRTFAEVAGGGMVPVSERRVNFVAARFRNYLEEIAESGWF